MPTIIPSNAGPNAVIYCLNDNVSTIMNVMCHFFPALSNETTDIDAYCNCTEAYQNAIAAGIDPGLMEKLGKVNRVPKHGKSCLSSHSFFLCE